ESGVDGPRVAGEQRPAYGGVDAVGGHDGHGFDRAGPARTVFGGLAGRAAVLVRGRVLHRGRAQPRRGAHRPAGAARRDAGRLSRPRVNAWWRRAGLGEDVDMTVERSEPAQNADERAMLEGWLEYHRQTLAWKCEGLTDAQLRTASVEPSELSLM